MKINDETDVEVAAVAVVKVINVLKSTLTTVPPENPMSMYIEESKLMEANFLTVYVVAKVILFG